jgi:hypothetical protein
LFVSVSIEGDAPLLLEHSGVLLAWVEPDSTEVTFHKTP